MRRFRHDSLSDGIHPDIPRDRVAILGPTEDVVVEAALPETARKFVAKSVSCRLLPLRDKFDQVRRRALCFYEEVDVIRHQAVRVYQKSHGLGDAFEGLDGCFGAICIQEDRITIFATDCFEVDSCTYVLITGEANFLAGSYEHNSQRIAERVGRAKARPYIKTCRAVTCAFCVPRAGRRPSLP